MTWFCSLAGSILATMSCEKQPNLSLEMQHNSKNPWALHPCPFLQSKTNKRTWAGRHPADASAYQEDQTQFFWQCICILTWLLISHTTWQTSGKVDLLAQHSSPHIAFASKVSWPRKGVWFRAWHDWDIRGGSRLLMEGWGISKRTCVFWPVASGTVLWVCW